MELIHKAMSRGNSKWVHNLTCSFIFIKLLYIFGLVWAFYHFIEHLEYENDKVQVFVKHVEWANEAPTLDIYYNEGVSNHARGRIWQEIIWHAD